MVAPSAATSIALYSDSIADSRPATSSWVKAPSRGVGVWE